MFYYSIYIYCVCTCVWICIIKVLLIFSWDGGLHEQEDNNGDSEGATANPKKPRYCQINVFNNFRIILSCIYCTCVSSPFSKTTPIIYDLNMCHNKETTSSRLLVLLYTVKPPIVDPPR